MSFCPSGISGPIAGLQDDIYLSGTGISLAIAKVIPGGIAWLDPILALVVSELILHLPTFCAADPPADPGLTGAQVTAALTQPGTPDGRAGAAAITQFVQHVLWWNVCQCLTSTTPAAPTAPVAPSGSPGYNPSNVAVPAKNTPCLSAYTGAPGIPFWSIPYLQDQNSFQLGRINNPGRVWSTLVLTLGTPTITGTPHAGSFLIQYYTGPQQQINPNGSFTQSIPATGIVAPLTLPIPANTTWLAVTCVGGSSGTGKIEWPAQRWDIYCDGQAPGGTVSPCCPPDADLVAQVQQILTMVNLIQRQAVPFAYVAGPAHTGLSGTGTISVSGILGLAVMLTTVPTQLGDELGTPPRLFDAGWLNLGTSDGYERYEPVTSAAQLVIPPSASLVTTVGYSLHSGVVATITELIREP